MLPGFLGRFCRPLPGPIGRGVPAALLWSVLLACGGGSSGGNDSPSPSPSPSPGPGGSVNPCSAASVEGEAAPFTAPALPGGAPPSKATAIDGNPRWNVLDALWTHRQHRARRSLPALSSGADSIDVGDIAVVQDEGDLIAPPNQYDLQAFGLRFTRNNGGGYDVRRIDGAFRTTLGSRLALSDDDSRQVNVPFGFSFYGRSQTSAFVNSDGNITFEEEDRASTERNIARLLTGPPRVAPFLADLDPSAGGSVYAHAAGDQYTVTWCGVRGFESTRTATVQATLLPDGTIELKYGDAITLRDAVVGVSPGRTGEFTPVNLSDSGPTGGGSAALGERFAERALLDTVALAQKFYRTHSDAYDQLVIWTDTSAIQDGFAYETTIANEIGGIGLEIFDVSSDFGSGGRLRSLAVMDDIAKYPDNPLQKFLGENTTVSVLGQEVGHRWLAFLEFRDHTGRRSDALLGRGAAHWSFFFDSDASVMEGNDIEDLGGGSFRTVAAVERFSALDQYAMGLRAESEVPPFFYVENPVNVAPARESDDAPRLGVTFNGTRRDVLIRDIVEVNGRRSPSAAESPREHRQAFVFVVGAGRTASAAQVDKIDRIRRAWETFFLQATDGRMRARTSLR